MTTFVKYFFHGQIIIIGYQVVIFFSITTCLRFSSILDKKSNFSKALWIQSLDLVTDPDKDLHAQEVVAVQQFLGNRSKLCDESPIAELGPFKAKSPQCKIIFTNILWHTGTLIRTRTEIRWWPDSWRKYP